MIMLGSRQGKHILYTLLALCSIIPTWCSSIRNTLPGKHPYDNPNDVPTCSTNPAPWINPGSTTDFFTDCVSAARLACWGTVTCIDPATTPSIRNTGTQAIAMGPEYFNSCGVTIVLPPNMTCDPLWLGAVLLGCVNATRSWGAWNIQLNGDLVTFPQSPQLVDETQSGYGIYPSGQDGSGINAGLLSSSECLPSSSGLLHSTYPPISSPTVVGSYLGGGGVN
ncbi:hypothetical protein MMC09_000605 [Bachmanniomyces sp. S44760]|nr:hypothetical protein [Bachmanniomyces sp. S44760]